MKLSERIRENRIRCGFSQEKLAELMDVSRQAVTKWERGQSAPSTENLFRLAEIFGTTVDMLLPKEKEPDVPVKRRLDAEGALMVIGIFLLTYVLGRVLYTEEPVFTFSSWLFDYRVDRFAYLYGWLLDHGRFWYCMVPCVIAAIFGKRRLAITASVGFSIGIPVGEWLGPNPEGAAIGQGHYGWAIWGCIFLVSMLLGIFLERRKHG